MTSACGTADPEALVRSLIGVAECQAAALGNDGWHALATSGLFAAVLTGLLTLAVARQGYRLLGSGSGGGVAAVDWLALALRFGIVIALCTSWIAYDRLVYRVAMDGPAEIAGVIFPSAGIQTGALAARLQNAHDAIATPPLPDETAPLAAGQTPAPPSEAIVSPGAAPAGAGLPGTDRRSAATLLVVMGAGPWIAARFAMALLLAIGPFAIVATLFDVSAGLCIGWLRALVGTALASLVIPLALALELQMLEGPVQAATRAGAIDIPGLGAIVWSFALVMAMLVFVAQRLAGGLRLPRSVLTPTQGDMAAPASPAAATIASGSTPRTTTIASSVPVAPSRATAIAQAAEARVLAAAGNRSTHLRTIGSPPALAATGPSQRGLDLLDSARRTTAGRRTLSAKRLEARL